MRYASFGTEPEGSLLTAERVAEASLETIVSDATGQVVYVTR
jgi:2-C-methyl-D-erythritol 4-phosphate cytidylyltransferase